ncbi:MAG TPA: aminopeptidase [Steroidobacteraceae bacterium]|nr:aminopeptidase [Steroidobacteraceae bacterium]
MNGISILRRIAALAAIGVLAASSSGCYEWQAAAGQAAVLWRREPIARVIANPATAPRLRAELREVAAIRDYASRELALPDNGSYRSYAALDRKYVLWNVFAAPRFSLRAKRWCYPFVGCMAYRGYFVRRRAHADARKLRAEGYDVSVQGVAAYSTLGHFDDPVLSTMMGWSDVDLAAIIFHELTHQLLFVPDDTRFDEGLATFVEREGVRRWLESQGRLRDLAGYERGLRRYDEVLALLRRARERLTAIYGASLDPARMLARKRAEFAALHAAYARLSAPWGRGAPLASWLHRRLNNADLASLATYERCVPGFARQFALAGGSFPAFFARIRAIAALGRKERDAAVCGAPAPAVSDRGPRDGASG